MGSSGSIIQRNQLQIIIVAALGYFVDIYDLVLFQVIKEASLLDLGLSLEEIKAQEVILFNWQMIGMLLGGLFWGILGDRLGRLRILFGSILIYSLANIANAYVWDLNSYAAIRFIAGLGLAGELGAGITLISEIMDKNRRGYGTMIVVTFGALGAVVAYLVADLGDNWQLSYWVGGLMGLALLVLRLGTLESGMYKQAVASKVSRGKVWMLFNSPQRFLRYMACICLGLPVWFAVGVLVNLSVNYFDPIFQFKGGIETGPAVMYCYIGLSIGDLLAGLFSQWFRSRLKVIGAYLLLCAAVCYVYFFESKGADANFFYGLTFMLGIGTGYWALFVTVAAEQFGTNIRSTVANTVPNMVRGAVVPITLSFKWLEGLEGWTAVDAGLVVGGLCIGLAALSAAYLKESFGKDLNYLEV